MLILNSRNSRS